MLSEKRMLLLLAVNAIISNVANSDNMSIHKNEVLYNKMIKNINSNKSNKKNYKLIENILSQRNKELKELFNKKLLNIILKLESQELRLNNS